MSWHVDLDPVDHVGSRAAGDATPGPDGVPRCPWALGSEDYRAYHDLEWGRPVHGDVALFERLCLEGFQSGLSWITILRKRPAFRELFADFDPTVVAVFDERDVERLLGDVRIVRHRGKIQATIGNARALLRMWGRDGPGALDRLIWNHSRQGSRPATLADVPAWTDSSAALSRELRARGFRFVGPTTCYAAMQACGVVDDHLIDCHLR